MNWEETVNKQLDIIHNQQKIIDSLTEIVNKLTKPAEEKIVVAESQKAIGHMPWRDLKVNLERKYASKEREAVRIYEGSDERSDNGELSAE